MFGLIPLQDDYSRAQELIKHLMNIHLSNEAREDFYNTVIRHVSWESRIMNALPSLEHLQVAADKGIQELHQQSAIRDRAFLETNGRCLDNMVPGPSTIRQAGRGACATRFLPKLGHYGIATCHCIGS